MQQHPEGVSVDVLFTGEYSDRNKKHQRDTAERFMFDVTRIMLRVSSWTLFQSTLCFMMWDFIKKTTTVVGTQFGSAGINPPGIRSEQEAVKDD